MLKQVRISVIALLSTVFGGSFGVSATGAEPTARQAKAEIEQILTSVEVAIGKGADGDTLTKMMYPSDSTDILIVGYGPPQRGIESVKHSMEQWTDSLGPLPQRKCKFEVLDPVVATAVTLSAFTNLDCTENSNPNGQSYHILYVWKKGRSGWRVVLEMVANGHL